MVLEVSQKQAYIFKTDRLVENIGASIIIRDITEELPKKYAKPENFVFEGGGKSVYCFADDEAAKGFIEKVTVDVLSNYPGVEVFMAMHGYDNHKESIIEAINELYGKLEKKKAARKEYFRVLGLGITESCADTQMPASESVYIGDEKILVSAEVACKIKKGREKQDEIFKELLPEGGKYRFAREFEDLGGSKGSKNYISIIVMDGNKMGKKIEKFRDDFRAANPDVSKETNDEYKVKIRELSEEIDRSYKKAVKSTIQELADNLEALQKKGVVKKSQKDDEFAFLPIRPLVLAGDDICIVTDARIGLDVAERVLKGVEENKIQGLPMRACAGVAIVKTGYPFFRAHELAEELCHNAKSILPVDDKKDASVIDFHMDQGELAGSLSVIRKEQYLNSSLTNKPYYISPEDDPTTKKMKNMDSFRKRVSIYNSGRFGRGFVKQYRDALYEGEDKAKKYLSDKRQDDRRRSSDGDHAGLIGSSFVDGHCVDFDAIEMMDIYHRIK